MIHLLVLGRDRCNILSMVSQPYPPKYYLKEVKIVSRVQLPLLLFLPRPSLSITSSAHCIRFLLRTPVSAPRRRNTGCRICTSEGACVCVCEAVAATAERANNPEGGGARDDVVAAAMFEL